MDVEDRDAESAGTPLRPVDELADEVGPELMEAHSEDLDREPQADHDEVENHLLDEYAVEEHYDPERSNDVSFGGGRTIDHQEGLIDEVTSREADPMKEQMFRELQMSQERDGRPGPQEYGGPDDAANNSGNAGGEEKKHNWISWQEFTAKNPVPKKGESEEGTVAEPAPERSLSRGSGRRSHSPAREGHKSSNRARTRSRSPVKKTRQELDGPEGGASRDRSRSRSTSNPGPPPSRVQGGRSAGRGPPFAGSPRARPSGSPRGRRTSPQRNAHSSRRLSPGGLLEGQRGRPVSRAFSPERGPSQIRGAPLPRRLSPGGVPPPPRRFAPSRGYPDRRLSPDRPRPPVRELSPRRGPAVSMHISSDQRPPTFQSMPMGRGRDTFPGRGPPMPRDVSPVRRPLPRRTSPIRDLPPPPSISPVRGPPQHRPLSHGRGPMRVRSVSPIRPPPPPRMVSPVRAPQYGRLSPRARAPPVHRLSPPRSVMRSLSPVRGGGHFSDRLSPGRGIPMERGRSPPRGRRVSPPRYREYQPPPPLPFAEARGPPPGWSPPRGPPRGPPRDMAPDHIRHAPPSPYDAYAEPDIPPPPGHRNPMDGAPGMRGGRYSREGFPLGRPHSSYQKGPALPAGPPSPRRRSPPPVVPSGARYDRGPGYARNDVANRERPASPRRPSPGRIPPLPPPPPRRRHDEVMDRGLAEGRMSPPAKRGRHGSPLAPHRGSRVDSGGRHAEEPVARSRAPREIRSVIERNVPPDDRTWVPPPDRSPRRRTSPTRSHQSHHHRADKSRNVSPPARRREDVDRKDKPGKEESSRSGHEQKGWQRGTPPGRQQDNGWTNGEVSRRAPHAGRAVSPGGETLVTVARPRNAGGAPLSARPASVVEWAHGRQDQPSGTKVTGSVALSNKGISPEVDGALEGGVGDDGQPYAFNEDEQSWYYVDPQAKTQGPCTIRQFRGWLDYLKKEPQYVKEYNQFVSVQVWRDGMKVRMPLLQLLERNRCQDRVPERRGAAGG